MDIPSFPSLKNEKDQSTIDKKLIVQNELVATVLKEFHT